MILDVRTVTVMIILGSGLMGFGLLAVSRSYLGRTPGVAQWARATLIGAVGWTVMGPLSVVLAPMISIVIGYGLLGLSLAMYLAILPEFTGQKSRATWGYGLVALQSFVLIVFVASGQSLEARMTLVTAAAAILMLASSRVLLFDAGRPPVSHRLTGLLFGGCGLVIALRSLYQLILQTAPGLDAASWMSAVNNVTYLAFYATATLLPFGFALMVSHRYIAEQQGIRAALEKSEARHRAITHSAYDAIITLDHRGVIVGWNPGAVRIFGYDESEVLDQPFTILIPPAHRAEQLAVAEGLRSGPEPDILNRPVEWPGLRKDGGEFPAELTISRWNSSDGWFVTAIVGDVTLRKQAEEALRSSLREKEALLKETHHRVKNNLSLITSLMRLTAGESHEPETKAVLKDMQGRVHSVTLLNEMLYRTGSYARVNLAEYLRPIATHLFEAHNEDADAVHLVLDLAKVEVETAQAIPCGLMVNELITNSLKHAFNFGGRGEVRLVLRPAASGQVLLSVSDTGAGLPADFSAPDRGSLGLQLVSDLVRQIGGTLDIGPGPGASFVVTFNPKNRATREIPPP